MGEEKYTAFTQRQPIGVVAGIVPEFLNYDCYLETTQRWHVAAPSSLKPSEYTPR